MKDIILSMLRWVHEYYGNGTFFLLAIISYIYLFCEAKEWREKLIYPILLMLVIIFNPLLYKYVLTSGRFWRWFWTLPNIYVTAAAVVKLVRKTEKAFSKILIFSALIVAVVFAGFPVYNETDKFSFTENLYKIDQEIVEICDMILEEKEEPKCIFCFPLYNRVRQVSGDIKQYYGRDANGYIMKASDTQKEVWRSMLSDDPDYDMILAVAAEEKCDFITVEKEKEIPDQYLSTYHYRLFAETENYMIYEGL